MSEILYQKTEGETATADMEICKLMQSVLNQHYPGWIWDTEVHCDRGVAVIFNKMLSDLYGFVMHLNAYSSSSEFVKAVMVGGGEFLERFGAKRGGFNMNEYHKLKIDGLRRFEVSL